MKFKVKSTAADYFIYASRRSARNYGGSGQVAEYESLLDLFTLVSFILIIAAFVYVDQSAKGSETASDIASQIAQIESGDVQRVPQDILMIILSKENQVDKITFFGGPVGATKSISATRENIQFLLDSFASIIMKSKIHFAIDNRKAINPGLAMDIEHWFARNHCSYRFYFTEDQ